MALKEAVGDSIPILKLTKTTLVHVSHTLEDMVLRHTLPALIFTGFQESSHWQQETARYRHLSQVAKQICIFAGEPLPEESAATALQIQLDEDDPFRQEWFLAILSSEFSVVLCGLDQHANVDDEGLRTFEVIWSFEPELVSIALDVVEQQLEHYRPDVLPTLQQARLDYPLRQPSARLITEFTAEMIAFEDRLHQLVSQKNLKISEYEALRAVALKNAPVVLVVVDAEGVVLYHDWGRVPRLQVIQPLEPNQPIYKLKEHLPDLDELVAKILAGNIVQRSYTLSDGSIIELHGSPIVDESIITGAVLVLLDVTELRRAESLQREYEHLQDLFAQEQALSALKDRVMRVIAHEFRTPLAVMLNASQILLQYADRLTETERQEGLLNIQRQIMRLSEMVQDVSLMMRSSNKQLLLRLKPLDLRQLIEEEIHYVRTAHQSQHQIQLNYQLPETMRPQLDERVFRRAIQNVLSNAVKYSSSNKPIEISVFAEDDVLVICVSDQGMGIPQEDLASIYQPFQRGANVETVSGLGLGLSIVHDGVKLHGGSIEIDSAEGEGTTVTLRVPLIE